VVVHQANKHAQAAQDDTEVRYTRSLINDLSMSHMGQKAALTVRYLGIEVDDALAIAEQVDV